MSYININGYETIEKIGKGSYGDVYKVKSKETGQNYAAKVINNDDENVSREIETMKKITNPTIIKYIDYIDDSKAGKKVIIMELSKVPLSTVLEEVESGTIPPEFNNTIKQIILIGICYGMKLLHENKIIHRDLKPGNILLDDNYRPKITDFGSSKIFQNENSISLSKGIVGTPLYMAPEVISGDICDTKSDVFSFSIILYEIITENEPYSKTLKRTHFKLLNAVSKGERPKFQSPINPVFKDLIEKCWSNNPLERPYFEEIFYKLAFNQDIPIAEFNDHHKYYLDDVDEEKIREYVKFITKNTDDDISNNDGKKYPKLASLVEKISFENKFNDEIIKYVTSQIKVIDEKCADEKKVKFLVTLYQKAIEMKSISEMSIYKSSEISKYRGYYENLINEFKACKKELDQEAVYLFNKYNDQIDQSRLNEIIKIQKNIDELKSQIERQSISLLYNSQLYQTENQIHMKYAELERISRERHTFLNDILREKQVIIDTATDDQKDILRNEISQIKAELDKVDERIIELDKLQNSEKQSNSSKESMIKLICNILNLKINDNKIFGINIDDANEREMKTIINQAFLNIVKEDVDLFERRKGKYWFKYHKNPSEKLLHQYYNVGLLFSSSIYRNYQIPIKFARCLYKKLLHRPIDPIEIAFFDPNYSDLINNLVDQPEKIKDIQFRYDDYVSQYIIDLKTFEDVTDEGEEHHFEMITPENSMEFINNLVEWIFERSIKEEFEAFEKGFNTINQFELIFTSLLFDESDIISHEENKWNIIKKNAKYTTLSKTSDTVRWFWQYFDRLDEKHKIKLIFDSYDMENARNLKDVKLKIKKSKHPVYIPEDQILSLPEFSSFDKLVDECNDYFFDSYNEEFFE